MGLGVKDFAGPPCLSGLKKVQGFDFRQRMLEEMNTKEAIWELGMRRPTVGISLEGIPYIAMACLVTLVCALLGWGLVSVLTLVLTLGIGTRNGLCPGKRERPCPLPTVGSWKSGPNPIPRHKSSSPGSVSS
jgi:hypothetical protein